MAADQTMAVQSCRKDNAMVICHALTGSSDVEDWCVSFASLLSRCSLISQQSITGGDPSSVLRTLLTPLATSFSAPTSSARLTVLRRRRQETRIVTMEDGGDQSSLLPSCEMMFGMS